MVTHSNIVVWEIPWTEEPGRLQSIGWYRLRHYWNNLACTYICLFWTFRINGIIHDVVFYWRYAYYTKICSCLICLLSPKWLFFFSWSIIALQWHFSFCYTTKRVRYAVVVIQCLSHVQLFATPWNAALLCSLLSPRVCSNSCLLSQWCYLTISPPATPFSSAFCLQSFPASGSFPISQLFPYGSQSFGASALTMVLPMNIEGWFPLGLTRLISLQSKGLLRIFSSTIWKHQVFGTQPSLLSLSADSWQIEGENAQLSPPSWTSLPLSHPAHLVTTEPWSGLSPCILIYNISSVWNALLTKHLPPSQPCHFSSSVHILSCRLFMDTFMLMCLTLLTVRVIVTSHPFCILCVFFPPI